MLTKRLRTRVIPIALISAAQWIMFLLCFAETIRALYSATGNLPWRPAAALGSVFAVLISAALRWTLLPEIPLAIVWGTFGYFADAFSHTLGRAIESSSLLLAALLVVVGFGLPFIPVILKVPRIEDLTSAPTAEPPNNAFERPLAASAGAEAPRPAAQRER
jgi:hypothetical protein